MSMERALGTLSLVSDIIPTGGQDKLHHSQPGTAGFDLMLATLLFDVARRMIYIHEATRPYALHADPEIAARYHAEVLELRALGQDYAALAERTHELLLDTIRRNIDDNVALLEMVQRFNRRATGEQG
jgi:hypothetical protein